MDIHRALERKIRTKEIRKNKEDIFQIVWMTIFFLPVKSREHHRV